MNQTRKDTIYWQQYLTFRRVTTRVFKDYIGIYNRSYGRLYQFTFWRETHTVNVGTSVPGYGEIAYLGDAYQMSIDRLSELQDLIDKFNAAQPSRPKGCNGRDCKLPGRRLPSRLPLLPTSVLDTIVGALLMLGEATVYNEDAAITSSRTNNKLLEITLPFNFHQAEKSREMWLWTGKNMFISYLREKLHPLAPDYGVYAKMVMTRASFNKLILGSSEFGEQYKMILGSNEMKLRTGLVSSSLASEVFTGIGLPRIEIKEDYVKDQTGKNVQIYADNRIALLPSDNIGYMRHHTPYEATDPVQGRTYIPSERADAYLQLP